MLLESLPIFDHLVILTFLILSNISLLKQKIKIIPTEKIETKSKIEEKEKEKLLVSSIAAKPHKKSIYVNPPVIQPKIVMAPTEEKVEEKKGL